MLNRSSNIKIMIWIIGGTINARELSQQIVAMGKECILTTTTSYGKELSKLKGLQVYKAVLNELEMETFIHDYDISIIVDASHLYATEVSATAISISEKCNIVYIRYERKRKKYAHAKYYKTYDEIKEALCEQEGAVLLTIGMKNAYRFANLEHEVYVKVLPTVESIQTCIDAGYSSSQILAMRGKVGKELFSAIILEYNIKHMVTKDSGEEGGMDEKMQVCQAMGVSCYVLKRPIVQYPLVFDNYEEIIEKVMNKDKN